MNITLLDYKQGRGENELLYNTDSTFIYKNVVLSLDALHHHDIVNDTIFTNLDGSGDKDSPGSHL